MAFKKKSTSTKVYAAIILIVVLAIATAAIVYTATKTSPSSKPAVLVGVNVGDTFTYNITGESILFSASAVSPSYLVDDNNTDYYQVTITGISGPVVEFNTVWKFTNGTAIQNSEWVNLESGNNSGDFWAIYPSNLNINNLLYPKEENTALTVNNTDTQTYANSTRERNFISVENVFTDPHDPTGSTQQERFMSIYFDKQTGMLTQLTSLQQYNNPQYNVAVTWKLINSTVWDV